MKRSASLAPASEYWTNTRLKSLLVPLAIEQLLLMAIGLVDTVTVATVGESAVSGVSLVDSIHLLIMTTIVSLANGGAVVVSQYLGNKDNKNASLAARQLIYILMAFSVIIMVLILVFRTAILSFVFGHIEPDVMENAQSYLLITAVMYPFVALYNGAAALFRCVGNSRISMWIMVAANIFHLGGNLLLIFGLKWGAAGAAASTLATRILIAVFIVWMLFRGNDQQISLTDILKIRLIPDMIKRILNVALPNGVENVVFQIGKLVVARIISSFGTAAIAGNAIANVLANIVYMPGNGFVYGILIVVGYCVGAGDIAGARRYTAKLSKVIWAITTGICVLMIVLLNPILAAFNLSAEATELTRILMYIFCVAIPLFWVPSFFVPAALRGAGDVKYNMVTAMLSMWLFRIAGAYLLAYTFGLGVAGVWIAMVIDWAARSAFYIVRWRGKKWETKLVIK